MAPKRSCAENVRQRNRWRRNDRTEKDVIPHKTAVTRELEQSRRNLSGVRGSVAEEIGIVHSSQGDYFAGDM